MARPRNPNNIIHKTCPTCKRNFTHEKRKPKTYCSKPCAANSPEVKEKNRSGVIAAFEAKYGGHPMAVNADTKEAFKETMLEKYGVEHAPQMAEFVKKVKSTKKQRYGDENYNNHTQAKNTCLSKYGADNYRKTSEYKTKYEATCLKKYGIKHASQTPLRKEQINSSNFKQAHKLSMFKKFVESEKFKNFEPLFSIEEYAGVTVAHNRPYKFKCKRCGGENDYNLAKQYLRCPVCDSTLSTFQSEVADYIKTLVPNEPIVINNRTILSPLEIDILLPNKNVAIETNGLYWHAEISGGKNKNYHINKTKLALAKGVRLIHISENEWRDKQFAVKLILKSLLLKPTILSSEVTVRHITPNEKQSFLETYHLQGNDASMVRLGLFDKESLVAVMTFSKSKFEKTHCWEISRYCSIQPINPTILFSAFLKEYSPKIVIAHCDRRYFSGETYMALGFRFIKHTAPAYHYIIDGYRTTEPKFNWQKSKLSKKLLSFDPTLSEWDNMKMNGFDRIWDCGHSKWIWVDNCITKA